jgi:FdhD protein
MKHLPLLSNAAATLTHDIDVLDERGRASTIAIPAERPLTVYVW